MTERYRGTIRDFVPKEVGCEDKAHAFSGTVCLCGQFRIVSRWVQPGSMVDLERTGATTVEIEAVSR